MKKSNKKISALARLIKIVPQIQRNYKISDYEKINTDDVDEIHRIGQERIKRKRQDFGFVCLEQSHLSESWVSHKIKNI